MLVANITECSSITLKINEIILHLDNILGDAHSTPSEVKLSYIVFIEPFWSSSVGCSIVECSLATNIVDIINFISPWLKLSFSSALDCLVIEHSHDSFSLAVCGTS